MIYEPAEEAVSSVQARPTVLILAQVALRAMPTLIAPNRAQSEWGTRRGHLLAGMKSSNPHPARGWEVQPQVPPPRFASVGMTSPGLAAKRFTRGDDGGAALYTVSWRAYTAGGTFTHQIWKDN
jgi:hypothetical protein